MPRDYRLYREDILQAMETAKLSTNPKFLALIERSRARRKAEGGVSSTEIRQRLNL